MGTSKTVRQKNAQQKTCLDYGIKFVAPEPLGFQQFVATRGVINHHLGTSAGAGAGTVLVPERRQVILE